MNEATAIRFLTTCTRSKDSLASRLEQLHQALLVLDQLGLLDAYKLQAVRTALAAGNLNHKQSIAVQAGILDPLSDLLGNRRDAGRAVTAREAIDSETGPGKPGRRHGPLRA